MNKLIIGMCVCMVRCLCAAGHNGAFSLCGKPARINTYKLINTLRASAPSRSFLMYLYLCGYICVCMCSTYMYTEAFEHRTRLNTLTNVQKP